MGVQLRWAAAAMYLALILWVVLHPSGRGGDFVNFAENAGHAVPVAAWMVATVGLYLVGSKTSSDQGIRCGCVSSAVGFIAVLVAAFTLFPESWSQEESAHVVGNLLWVAVTPGIAVFAFRLRPSGADRNNVS